MRSGSLSVVVISSLLSAPAAIAAPGIADVIEVGYMYNSSAGVIHYEGQFGEFVTSRLVQRNQINYTVIAIDITGLLMSINERAFRSIFVLDTGENVYTSTPGADIDLFTIDGLSEGNGYSFVYDGPVSIHQNETAAQLGSRVAELDWGTNGGGLASGTFVSLGEFGTLRAVLDEVQYLNEQHGGGQGGPGGNGLNGLRQISMELSEVGTSESFRVYIETVPIPAPAAAALLVAATPFIRPSRRRRSRN